MVCLRKGYTRGTSTVSDCCVLERGKINIRWNSGTEVETQTDDQDRDQHNDHGWLEIETQLIAESQGSPALKHLWVSEQRG